MYTTIPLSFLYFDASVYERAFPYKLVFFDAKLIKLSK